MGQPPRTPLRAASVILLRETLDDGGFEVFMMRRPANARFAPGAYSFPGGAVDKEDGDAAPALVRAEPGGTDVAALHRRMAGGGQYASPDEATTAALLVAAARELFEETGVLVARDLSGGPFAPLDSARWAAAREDVLAERLRFGALLAQDDLTICPDDLIYFSHWITPESSPIRFNTHFFLAVLPDGQEAAHWAGEMEAGEWVAPRAALDRHARGAMKMLPVQPRHLERLASFATLAALLDHARTKAVPYVVPVMGANGREVGLPEEVASCW